MIAQLQGRRRIEWLAGLFVLLCLMQALFTFATIAYRKGWFEKKVRYVSLLDTSEGLRVGSPVEMAGLRVGAVESIELETGGRVRASWYLLQRYADRVRVDSTIQVVRTFVIGEKTLILSQGSPLAAVLPPGSELQADNVVGFGDLLSGRHLAPYLSTISRTMELMRSTADTLLKLSEDSPEPMSVALVQTLKRMQSTFLHLTKITQTLAKGDRMDSVMNDIRVTSASLARWIPEFEKSGPNIAADVTKLVANLTVLTEELKKVAPELPKQGERLAEAVDEAVVVLKALQKTFLLSGSAREVKEEERKKRLKPAPEGSDSERAPAGENP